MRIIFCRAFVFCLIFAAGCASQKQQLKEPVFYPSAPDPPRVQFLASFSNSDDVADTPSIFQSFVLGQKASVAAIQRPWGVSFREDKIFVCDLVQATVLVLDLANHKFTSIRDTGRGKLRKPINCEFDATGDLYVADRERRQVVRYNSEYNFVRSYGPLDDKFLPLDMAIHGEELFVCDLGNRAVQVFDLKSGKRIRTLGSTADLGMPTNLSVDESGNCYVVDSLRNQVQVFDSKGNVQRTIGSPGDIVGQFVRAKGIDVDPRGYVYVVDSSTNVVQIFSPEGEVVMFFGGPGGRPGSLYLPTDVYIASEGIEVFKKMAAPDFKVEYIVIVANQFGPKKVNVYGFGRSEEFSYD